jgi:hypothetical protein
MTLEEFNKRLVLKKSPITQKEILKALAEISIYKSNVGFATNAQYDKAVECVMSFIYNQEILEPTIYYNLKDLLCYFLENYNDKLSVEQLMAINEYCCKNGIPNENALLEELKENGVLDENSPLEDLAEQVADETYETMYNYLVGV